MKTNGNDPAMPTIESQERVGETFWVDTYSSGGMSKREAFAMAAMQGMLSNTDCDKFGEGSKGIAECAVVTADALIEALNKEKA